MTAKPRICYCGALEFTEHDRDCPHHLYEATQEDAIEWVRQYRKNVNESTAAAMVVRAFSTLLDRDTKKA